MPARRNVLAGAVLLGAGLTYAYLTAGLPTRSLPDTPGPAFLPCLIAAGWIVLAAALLLRGLAGAHSAPAEPTGYRISARGWVALAAFLAYLLVLPMSGFIAPSVAFFATLAWLYGERNKIILALAAIAVPTLLFYLFTLGFQILLPRGPW